MRTQKHNFYHITLNPAKTRIGFSTETFFGFRVDEKGFYPTDKNLSPLHNFTTPPSNVSELRSFLGIAIQIKEFVQNFGVKCIPLNKLLKKDTAFVWGGEQQAAFEGIRTALLSGVNLQAPNYELPFATLSDASDIGWGESHRAI